MVADFDPMRLALFTFIRVIRGQIISSVASPVKSAVGLVAALPRGGKTCSLAP
jgi:hypothetical protein